MLAAAVQQTCLHFLPDVVALSTVVPPHVADLLGEHWGPTMTDPGLLLHAGEYHLALVIHALLGNR